MQRKDFIDVKRIVIKLGTNVLRNDEGEVGVIKYKGTRTAKASRCQHRAQTVGVYTKPELL